MRMLKPALTMAGGVIMANPGTVTGIMLFLTAFAIFAGNAVFKQANAHVSPLWTSDNTTPSMAQTEKAQGRLGDVVGSVVSNPVLMQKSLITHVPVPQVNPVKGHPVSAQSSHIREIQALLSEVGIYKGRNDGIFGEETRMAIREFQNRSGIIPDGTASFGLLASIKSAIAVSRSRAINTTPSAQPSQSSFASASQISPEIIARIQTALRDMYGEDQMIVDGILGKQTRTVLKKFQRRFNIGVTGELDRATMDKLREAGVINAG